MQKSFLKTFGLLACLACSGIANAVGLGGINVTSALGQPLKAEIELNSVGRADKSSLTVRLASPETFKNAGLDYPYSLPKIKFQIETRPNGDPYILVSTVQSVNEPFVSIMIDVNWASGRLLREYTFFLDPVGFVAEQPKAAEVKPIEPVVLPAVVVPPTPVVAAPVAESAPAEAPVMAAAPVVAEPAVVVAASAPDAATTTAQPAAAEPVAAETVVAESAPVAAEPVADQQPVEQAPAPAAEEVAASPEQEKAAGPVSTSAATGPVLVARGDTLGKLAMQNKAPEVSLERMLVAMYRANVDVFDGKNMNRLKAGKILRLPEAAEIEQIQQAEAKREIRAQVADWNAYRQKLAAAKMPAAEGMEAKQEASGKISSTLAEKAPAKESPKEVLKLSKGEVPGDKAVAGAGSKGAKDNAKEEDAIAKAKALKEAQERTAQLEKNVKDLKQLAELKNTQPPVAEAKKPDAAAPAIPLAASAATPASNVAAAKPKAAAPKVIAPPPSEGLLDDPVMLAGAAAAVLALGGIGYVVIRRRKGGAAPAKPADKKADKKKAKEEKEKNEDDSAARIATPVAPSPDTGDFTASAATSNEPAAAEGSGDEVDPIAEADLFLTFGRDVQAEEVLKEALHKDPGNMPVKMKLLGIYASRKDANAFSTYARQVKDSGNASAWEQVAAMGRELEPNNPMYGGSGAAAVEEVAESAAAPAVDFDLGFGGGGAAAVTPVADAHEFNSTSTVVMEPQSVEKTNVLASAELQAAAQAAPMDFDITGTHPGIAAPEKSDTPDALDMDDLVFDVTATHPKTEAAPSPAAPQDDDGGLAFTLDFPSASAPAKEAPAPVADIGLGDISLNLGDMGSTTPSGSSGEQKDERWHEVATKLDLAKAYQEMGDAAGAKEILEEVLRDGDDQQRGTAQSLLDQLSV